MAMRICHGEMPRTIRLAKISLVLLAAALTAPPRVQAGWFDCQCGPAPSCQAWPSAAGCGAGDLLATGPGESFADTPFDLGEAAPAQIGDQFAVAAPNFIGDFFGGPVGGGSFYTGFSNGNGRVDFPQAASGGLVGIQKLAENSTPIPRDRLFFNYSYYNNVQFTPGGLDVNRYVLGFEKTFLDEQVSFELRAPFASTLNSNIYPDTIANGTNTEFGNLTLYGKALLLTGDGYAVGAGLGISLPTADDINLLSPNGARVAQIRNESVQLLPYLGGVYAPNERFFAQGLLQIDTVTSGNPTYLNNLQSGLQRVGTLNDPTWLFASLNLGYWTYRTAPSERLSGIAPLFEIHYNKTLQDTDVVSAGVFNVGNSFSNLEMVNLVAGVNLEFFGRSNLSVAYVVPVTGGPDRFFDGELRVLCNRFYW
jgi:hypothetical protein